MEFKKYQHIERYGVSECEGITMGICYIFPKIDGTNSSVWLKDDKLYAGSRNRELSLIKDNANFYQNIIQQKKYLEFLKDHPNMRLYGEWLVPHSLKTYRDDAWNKFYVFDVTEEDENGIKRYIPYSEYKEMLDLYKIEYIPPIAIIHNPTYEKLIDLLEQNDYLIKNGCGIGEGIVIKNYEYKNKWGNIIWAKIVSSEFKEKHNKVMMNGKDIVQGNAFLVEEKIVETYVTKALCEKVKAKIEEKEEWTTKLIPRLLNTVFYELVNEDCWHFVKELKYPTINFKTLLTITINKIKELMPELFKK